MTARPAPGLCALPCRATREPLTTSTPRSFAALAIFFTSSAQGWRTPSGLPSPQSLFGSTLSCLSSIGSHTH
jgi:hypothetical protein